MNNEDVWSDEFWENIDSEWDYCDAEYQSILDEIGEVYEQTRI